MTPIKLHRLLQERGIETSMIGDKEGCFNLLFVVRVESHVTDEYVIEALEEIGGHRVRSLGLDMFSAIFTRSKE